MRQSTPWLIIAFILILAVVFGAWVYKGHHRTSPGGPKDTGAASSAPGAAGSHGSQAKMAAEPGAKEPLPASIGVATMTNDGTIVLDLRAEGVGMMGEGHLLYPPTDKRYAEILKHLGGLQPGEHKSVPPWPDQNR